MPDPRGRADLPRGGQRAALHHLPLLHGHQAGRQRVRLHDGAGRAAHQHGQEPAGLRQGLRHGVHAQLHLRHHSGGHDGVQLRHPHQPWSVGFVSCRKLACELCVGGGQGLFRAW